MIDREGSDGVTHAVNVLTICKFVDVDGKRGTLEAESLHAFENSGGAFWTPESQWVGPTLKRHRANQSDDAEQVIGVHVSKEDVLEGERDAVPHHLTLGAFAAIEHQRFAFAVDGE